MVIVMVVMVMIKFWILAPLPALNSSNRVIMGKRATVLGKSLSQRSNGLP